MLTRAGAGQSQLDSRHSDGSPLLLSEPLTRLSAPIISILPQTLEHKSPDHVLSDSLFKIRAHRFQAEISTWKFVFICPQFM